MAFRKHMRSWRNPDLVIRFREVSLSVAKLEARPDVAAGVKEQASSWLVDAQDILDQRHFGILPYDRYDAVWALINQLRHLLCSVLPAPDLLAVLADVRASCCYLPQQQRLLGERELARLEAELIGGPVPGAAIPAATSEPLPRIRLELERLSRLVAGAREAHWRKVNLLRKRLTVTGSVLLVLLCTAFWLLPDLLRGMVITRPQLAGIMLFGAIGGLVSALWTNESIHASSAQFYLQRTLLALKPIVGAASATFIVLLQQAGFVSLLPANADPMTACLVLAFLAGFSERFIRTRIEEATNSSVVSVNLAAAEASQKSRKGQ